MRITRRNGNSFVSYVIVVAIVLLSIQFIFAVDVLGPLQKKISDGIEIISKRGYQINENISFEQIKAVGIKLTQESWEAFLQICDRLVLSFGHLTVYADIEARVMLVYDTSSQPQQAYYVTF